MMTLDEARRRARRAFPGLGISYTEYTQDWPDGHVGCADGRCLVQVHSGDSHHVCARGFGPTWEAAIEAAADDYNSRQMKDEQVPVLAEV